jgi:iron complex outermembrane recepter protein
VLTNPVQNVASFFNGVYLQKNYMVDASLLAIQQVEVLKGPQSALYGRNAFSGAINYTTRKPGDTLEGNVELTVGTDERYEATGWISLPLSDKFGIVLSAGKRDYDGTWENDHPLADDPQASTRGNLGGLDQRLGYIGAQFRPTEKLTFDIAYSYADSDKESAPLITRTGLSPVAAGFPSVTVGYVPGGLTSGHTAAGTGVSNMNCSTPSARAGAVDSQGRPLSNLPAVPSGVLYCGEIGADIGLAPGEVRNGNLIVDPRAVGYRGTSNLFSFNASMDLTDSWALKYTYGKVAGSSLVIGAPARDASRGAPRIAGTTILDPAFPTSAPTFAYLLNGTLAAFDPGLAGTQVTFDSRPNGNLSAKSHEIQAQFTGEGVVRSGLFGVYYSDTEDREQGASRWAAINSFDRTRDLRLPFPPFTQLGFTNTLIDTYVRSVYGSIELRFVDSLALELEGRYSREELSYYDIQNLVGGAPFFQELTDNHFEPRVSLTWSVNDDVNLYLSGAKGHKIGGFNGRTGVNAATGVVFDLSQREYEPEENTTYEIGAKTRWLDGRLIANLAVFYVDWTDLQQNEARNIQTGVNAVVSGLVIGNIGDAEVKGAELEGSFAFTDAWRLDYGISYADATFASGARSDRYFVNDMCDNIVCPRNGDISGNSIQRSPKTKANVGLAYQTNFGDGNWKFGARLDGTYQSKQYLDEMNLGWVPDRTLLNTAVTLSRGEFEGRLWVRNLTDEEYLSSSLVLVGTGGPRTTSLTSFYGEQREVGLTVSYKFGN